MEGFLSGRCIILERVEVLQNVYCVLTLDFPEGRIHAQGPFQEMNLVGGDGCYSEVSGLVGTDVDTFQVQREEMRPEECAPVSNRRWIEVPGETFVDFDFNDEESTGDIYVFDSNTIQSPTRTGVLSGDCVVTPSQDTFCHISYEFDDGTLTVQGLFNQRMVITGCTGCFYGVTGTVVGSFTSTRYFHDIVLDSGVSSCLPGIFDAPWQEQGEDTMINYDQDSTVQSPGDVVVFDFNRVFVEGGVLVGSSAGRCSTQSRPDEFDPFYCSILFTFDSNSLVIQGPYSNMAIVGGSGCFSDATGTVRGRQVGPQRYEYEFFLD